MTCDHDNDDEDEDKDDIHNDIDQHASGGR